MDVFDLLRWVCVLFFLPHLASKLVRWPGIVDHYEKARWPAPRFFALFGMFVEMLIVLFLLNGTLLEISYPVAAAFLLAAAVSTVRMNGLVWRWDQGGPEFCVFWAIILGLLSAHEWGFL